MSVSEKYGRTYHYSFSLGTTSDDRINHEWWENISKIEEVINTEKMDGENNCLSQFGIFARSHAAPTVHPWSNFLKPKWSAMQKDLESMDMEIFGENMYAVHSIRYPELEEHFYTFAIRQNGIWLSWSEVEEWSKFFDFKTVPVICRSKPKDYTEESFREHILKMISNPSRFKSIDMRTNLACPMEGVVTRNIESFPIELFKENVFKYVRKNHVSTGEHWTRNWKRAPLNWER